MNCPFCHPGVPIYNTEGHVQVKCEYCGRFNISAEALAALKDDAWKLSSYVWEMNRRGITPFFLPAQSSIPEVTPSGSVGIDAAIQAFPSSVAERLDRALVNLAAITQHLGQHIKIVIVEGCPLLYAQNTTEALFILEQLEQEGYLVGWTTAGQKDVSLTVKGLNRVADLQRGLFGPCNRQVFVAMSFDKSLDAAWTDGLKLGIEDCDYTALRVDAKEHNEKICDFIVAEIRKSKFLVADFSLHRQGVYFEAGLMIGLGRPVIFTCRKDELSKAHFDTRQYNHIEWEAPAELRERLKRRIQATIAP
jgi:nucleoside 2-deoxyribosyltransferase